MLTDDDEKRIAQIVEQAIERAATALLEAFGLKRPPSKAALRTQRYRERKAASQNVTPVTKRHKPKGESVTKRNGASQNVTPTAATWLAYSDAYKQRYHVEPTRNATVNGQLAQFVTRVPAAEAPAIAAFYVGHNRSFYISAKHAVGALLANAEALRTEWLTGNRGTDTAARMADRTQANAEVWTKLIREADEADKNTH